MNRKQFLKELRQQLDALPFEEREAAITYYEEYFDEAGPDREAETAAHLGAPAEIAAEIRVDYAVNKPPQSPKEGATKAWMVIVAIFAFPVAIPLAAVIFSVFVAFFSVIFSLGVAAVALLGGGIVTIIGGLSVIAASPVTTLFFVGGGLFILGLSIFFGYLTYIVATKLMGAFARLLGRMLQRVKARRRTA